MKALFFSLFIFLNLYAYGQNGINYKALIKDDLGNVVANQDTTVQFNIFQGIGMLLVYSERHNLITDNNGIVIVNIGEGSVQFGTYSGINWSSDDHFLNVQIDIDGNGLVDLGTTEFKTVPYAIQAEKALNVTGIEVIDEGSGAGWRIIGRDADNYGNVGQNAVDLSYSDTPSSEIGATGFASTTFGYITRATNYVAFATGDNSWATGQGATAMGGATRASGDWSTSIGINTEAFGLATFASGSGSQAIADYSMAIGENTLTFGFNSFAGGEQSQTIGNYSFAFGKQTTSSGENSVAFGNLTVADGENSAAFGNDTTATGENSFASGFSSEALGIYSVAMGWDNISSGIASTAFGTLSEASGNNSFASGLRASASGTYSAALGFNVLSESSYAVAIGRFNVGSGNPTNWISTDPLFEIGNGTGNGVLRNNALTVLKNGNVGIGTASPNNKLQITNGTDVSASNDLGFLVLGSGNSINIAIDNNEIMARNNAAAATLYLQNEGGPNASLSDNTGYMVLGNENFSNLVFDGNEIQARTNGSASTLLLQQHGGNVAVNGLIVHTSDRRLKKDISIIHYGLKDILKLNPVAYNWKNQHNQKHKSLGLIAQELQEVIAEVVSIEEVNKKMLHVNYTALIPVLIKAIQEQQKIIETQGLIITEEKDINEEQNKMFQALLKRVEDLENGSSD
ncbi:tail fiber domain-containing protein [uncultured Psychroserpens sp.]|uniref:tail fiber domain-containing protein n=1 Tax=uncultured Psychroserpens sp. TaxID=255436 RepID=UPI002604F586|nr:tail fiber domain-containing protein [uncultured Psychroserpens sp.]